MPNFMTLFMLLNLQFLLAISQFQSDAGSPATEKKSKIKPTKITKN